MQWMFPPSPHSPSHRVPIPFRFVPSGMRIHFSKPVHFPCSACVIPSLVNANQVNSTRGLRVTKVSSEASGRKGKWKVSARMVFEQCLHCACLCLPPSRLRLPSTRALPPGPQDGGEGGEERRRPLASSLFCAPSRGGIEMPSTTCFSRTHIRRTRPPLGKPRRFEL